MNPEMVLGLVGSAMALLIALGALRDARRWDRYMKNGGPPAPQPERKDDRPRDPDRPWG